MKKIIFIILAAFISLSAQDKNADNMISRVREKFKKVKDYEVNAKIKVDVDFIKVPEMNAKIYFKQPDKVKMNTDGFAMIPKQAFNISPEKLFSKSFTALFMRNEKLNGQDVAVVKVIPNEESSEVAITTLWIDSKNDLIKKLESTGKRGSSFALEFSYGNPQYALPSHVKFNFETPKFNNRVMNSKDKGAPQETNKQEKGSAVITYSDYKINKGIPDSFFVENAKK